MEYRSTTNLTWSFRKQVSILNHSIPDGINMQLSLERINAYIHIEQEPKATEAGIPPAYWPASGDIRVENLSARYSPVRRARV